MSEGRLTSVAGDMGAAVLRVASVAGGMGVLLGPHRRASLFPPPHRHPRSFAATSTR